ncbi:MAG TPA: acetyltransferase [Elusimicrobiota bacterium]|nr:acetyltransferase [Elusimicrobiota bacterium]
MNLLIIGSGGHAKVLQDILVNQLGHKVIGFTDPRPQEWGKRIQGAPILGNDAIVRTLLKKKKISAVAMGIGNRQMSIRKKLYETMTMQHIPFTTIIHPQAIVSATAHLSAGDVIMAGAIVNTGAHLGINVVVNTGAIVEHECSIGDHVYISPRVTLCGNVHVGKNSFIGAGATLIPDLRIEKNCVVGAGAVVIRDVPSGKTVVGIPAHPIGKTNFLP